MEQHALYGKRKKKKETCANPLFVLWLTEWREEAAEKGWKSQYTYGKAVKALKKFPLQLSSGKDCKILENFGDKTCKMLDDRLAKHVAEYGTTAHVNATDTVTDSIPSLGTYNQSQETAIGMADTLSSYHNNSLLARVEGRLNMTKKFTPPSHLATIPATQGLLHPGVAPVHGSPRRIAAPVHTMSDSSDDGDTAPPARKRQRSGRKSGDREYIPAHRSGPYAILLTLYADQQNPNSRGYMTKAELIRAAQPLADKSFSIPDPSSRYTAWSSMGTLTRKGFVIKESSPAKYSLTDAGCELAHRLKYVQGNTSNADPPTPIRNHQAPPTHQAPPIGNHQAPPTHQAPPPHQTPPTPEPARLPRLPSLDDDIDDQIPSLQDRIHVAASNPVSDRLRYWYVTDDGREVLQKDAAMVTIDDEISVGFLVKCNYTDLLRSGVRYKLDTSRPLGDDFVFVYLHNDDTDEVATPPVPATVTRQTGAVTGSTTVIDNSIQNTKKRKPATKSEDTKRKKPAKTAKQPDPQLLPLIGKLPKSPPCSLEQSSHSISKSTVGPFTIDSEDSSRDSLPCLALRIATTTDKTMAISSSSSTSSANYKYSENMTASLNNQNSGPKLPFTNSTVASKFPLNARTIAMDSQTSQDSQQSVSSIKSISSIGSGSSVHSILRPDFVLYPGQFEIVLCVDNAEYYGASKGSSKTLLPDLIRNGVDCELRKLHVGDILWIARRKTKPVPGQLALPQGGELVLDYIIERKRMDDLVSSCIDGRFKEQKFRLKKCGLRNPSYLIEDYGTMQHYSIPEASIKQAITNTQVIDGFQVKRTGDTKETVAFLTIMTRYLQSAFRNKTLYATSLEEIRDTTYPFDIDDSELRLATFQEFNQGSVKTKALTVQEMFGKQLIQVYGMSAEKSRAVIDKYQTPTSLLAAYDSCRSDKEREGLLSNIKCGKAARNLGIAQSKQICQLYRTTTALM